MEKEMHQCAEDVKTKGSEKRGPEYWEAWLSSKGDSHQVAKSLGVTYATVVEHVRSQSRANGFVSISHARKELGFKLRPSLGGQNVESRDLKTLLEVQGYRCALSGKKLTPETAELDHKTPVAKGGTNTIGNLQWLDKHVNRAKGTMDNDSFVAMCKAVASSAPGRTGPSSQRPTSHADH
jgi:hypothetical protein